jgi:hypothetical protein
VAIELEETEEELSQRLFVLIAESSKGIEVVRKFAFSPILCGELQVRPLMQRGQNRGISTLEKVNNHTYPGIRAERATKS